MFREALDYPTRPPRGGRAVLVGGTLLVLVGALAGVGSLGLELVPVALLAVPPWLLVRGYYVRTVRATVGREHPAPPRFGGVGELLRDGVAAVAIAAGYLLPGTAVLAPLVVARAGEADLVALLLDEGAGSGVSVAFTAVVGVLALFAVFALIGALYALPVAVGIYAATDSIRSAFDVRTVASGAATEDYVVAWGVSLLLQLLVLPVAYLLKPILVGFYVHFLVAVAVRYCYGQGVGAALDLPPVEPAFAAPRDEPAGAGTPAVRPIEESEVPALRTQGSTDEAGGPAEQDARGDGDVERGSAGHDGGGRRGDRSEGERT